MQSTRRTLISGLLAPLCLVVGFLLTASGWQSRQPKIGAPAPTSRLALPFKKSWVYLTDGGLPLPPTADGGRIFVPLAGGNVACLNSKTGSLLWSSQLGGHISSPIAVGDRAAYVVTRQDASTDSGAGSVRALDKETGLTLWVREYEQRFTGQLLADQDRLYCGNADGSLYAMSSGDGSLVWRAVTQDVVRGSPLNAGTRIYFGSDDGSLRGVESSSGKEVFKFQTKGRIIGRPALSESTIYFGSADGYVYAVDVVNGNLKWQSRTGAAVEASPIVAGSRVLVGSLDNFVYALARSRGDRLWKRRLVNRIAASLTADDDLILVTPFRSDHVAVFHNTDGRQVNIYRLDDGSEIIASPIYSDGTLLIPTDKGLVVVIASGGQASLQSP